MSEFEMIMLGTLSKSKINKENLFSQCKINEEFSFIFFNLFIYQFISYKKIIFWKFVMKRILYEIMS
jgi:hypothetical protein